MKKAEATLMDWAIVLYPDVYKTTENPNTVFATLNCGHTVALFGRAKDDPRFNAETGELRNGHRLITSPIIAVQDGKYHTENTIYTLKEEEKTKEFKKWCEENQYREIPSTEMCDKNENQNGLILRHICECCGKEQTISSEEAYAQGWDFPPKMGSFKMISPRTCGECAIENTLWWEITCNKTPMSQLSERHQQTLERILTEPESIMP